MSCSCQTASTANSRHQQQEEASLIGSPEETVVTIADSSCACLACNCRFIQQQQGLGHLIISISIPLNSKTSERIRLQHGPSIQCTSKCSCYEIKQTFIRELAKNFSLSFVHEFKSASLASCHDVHSSECVDADLVFRGLDKQQYSALASSLQGYGAAIVNSINNPYSNMSRIKISIEGMTCSACVNAIECHLEKQTGILACKIDLISCSGTAEYDSSLITAEQVISMVEDIGYDCIEIPGSLAFGSSPNPNNVIINVTIEGMTCSSCVDSVQKYLLKQEGILSCSISLLSNSGEIEYNPQFIGARDILSLIEGIGYESRLLVQNNRFISKSNTRELENYKASLLHSLVFVIPTFFLSMVFTMLVPSKHPINLFLKQEVCPGLTLSDCLLFVMATPVQFGFGLRFYKGAWKSLYLLNNYNMDVLVALGTSAAYFFSIYLCARNVWVGYTEASQFFETSVFLVFFILLGKYLETRAKGQTSAAIEHLLSLAPATAILVSLEHSQVVAESEISLELLQVGDLVLVNRGARIPSDGIVYQGSSHVDESMLTGESNLVWKDVGHVVMGGTISVSSQLFVKITKIGNDTTLARIVSLVQDAQQNKAPIQDIADRVSSVFVPSVLVLAFVTLFVWLFCLLNALISLPDSSSSMLVFSVEHAIAVLVIACPCALGLACPTACMVSSGVAAKLGILVKGGGAALEECTKISTIVFDKTGTLTLGRPTVSDIHLIENTILPGVFWRLIVAVENFSDHPLAKSLVDYGKTAIEEELVDVHDHVIVHEVTEIAGKGLDTKVSIGGLQHSVFVGTIQFLRENGCFHNCDEAMLDQVTSAWKEAGKSVVYIGALSFGLLGVLSVSDQSRPESHIIIQALRNRSIDVWMLTGDNRSTAQAVAAQLGILPSNVIAQVLPEEKYNRIKDLQMRASGSVAMVGDGINDSIALAQSDVGIAMGVGSHIAIESAQVVLVKSDLRDIIILVDLAHATINKIKWNFLWAMGYNLLGIPLAAGVFFRWGLALDPMFAGLAMALSSVSVVLNSLLLNFFRPRVD